MIRERRKSVQNRPVRLSAIFFSPRGRLIFEFVVKILLQCTYEVDLGMGQRKACHEDKVNERVNSEKEKYRGLPSETR